MRNTYIELIYDLLNTILLLNLIQIKEYQLHYFFLNIHILYRLDSDLRKSFKQQ